LKISNEAIAREDLLSDIGKCPGFGYWDLVYFGEGSKKQKEGGVPCVKNVRN
jgi:hypothetical protein